MMIINPNWNKQPIVYVKVIVNRYANFKQGKIYKAEAFSYNKNTGIYYAHKFYDEDGDPYYVENGVKQNLFKFVTEEDYETFSCE